MGVTVVTGWTGRVYDALGDQFITSFLRHWPKSVRLSVFLDTRREIGFDAYGGTLPRYIDQCEGLGEFVARHAQNLVAQGRKPVEPLGKRRWKPKEISQGYSWRFDAVKFATQLFIPEAAAKHLPDGEIMVWFDADVVTFKSVPEGFIEGVIGPADLCHLGRGWKHSELGFWAVRLSPMVREFLSALADQYRTDALFSLKEWHSAFVFDAVRKSYPLRQRDLTPGGHGHVWFDSPLGRYTDHLKGKRKLAGRSPERTVA